MTYDTRFLQEWQKEILLKILQVLADMLKPLAML